MDDLDEKSENLSLSVIIPNENSVNESLLSLLNGSEAHQLDLKFESYFFKDMDKNIEHRHECNKSYLILGSSTLVSSSSISFLGMYKGNGVTTSF